MSHVVRGLWAILAILFVFLAQTVLRAENAKVTLCKNETSAQCLTDLGVERAMAARTLPPYMHEVGMLAQMGRIEEAHALELRILSERDRPPENAEVAVNQRLASHRLTAAIRNGSSLQAAINNTPAVDPGDLWISALDLLGRSPYGPSPQPKRAPNAPPLQIITEMAETIEAMAKSETERSRTSHLINAAKLHAALGNAHHAKRLIAEVPQSALPQIAPPEELMRIIGAQTVLQLYRAAGGDRAQFLLTAAKAETDRQRAAHNLETAFSAFSAEHPWPDFLWMERTVQSAVQLGQEELALRLARELAERAQTSPSVLPAFPHLAAARALDAAGARDTEIRDSLARAEASFPRSDKDVVGVGVVSGPIVWGRSGLDAQARREIANLQARLGDVTAAIQTMDAIQDPVFAWNDMLTSNIPLNHIDALLDAARNVLTREEHAYVRAQHAQGLLIFAKADNSQRAWARATATDLLQEAPFEGERGALIYNALSRVAAKLDDQNMTRLVLTRMAQSALSSQDFKALITAGFQWHFSQSTP